LIQVEVECGFKGFEVTVEERVSTPDGGDGGVVR
jgi:hypothetical protein